MKVLPQERTVLAKRHRCARTLTIATYGLAAVVAPVVFSDEPPNKAEG
jgi:hypothetical protein